MGWGRTLLLGDIGNRLDIADTEEDISRIRRELGSSGRRDASQDRKIRELETENMELKLYLSSLIRILANKNVITHDELNRMVCLIDAEDGQVDGKHNGPIA